MKLVLTSFYCLRRLIWLCDLWKLVFIDQSRLYNSLHSKISKIFNITSKYFSVFDNTSSVAHTESYFHTYYFCSYFNFMVLIKYCTKKWSFPLRILSVNVTKSAVSCGLVTVTEEILNGKLHFLCSEIPENDKLIHWK